MSDELRECPMCGKTQAEILGRYWMQEAYYGICHVCGTEGPVVDWREASDEELRAEATVLWNTRVDDARIAELEAWCRELTAHIRALQDEQRRRDD